VTLSSTPARQPTELTVHASLEGPGVLTGCHHWKQINV
jgi:hypothetical protein